VADAPVPREAVRKMAPYVPPTGGRHGKLRLDFNENTVGCSPRVIDLLRRNATADWLAVYPDYAEPKMVLARHFRVSVDQFALTNGTDEAIQLFLNTYIGDLQEVVLLRPSYAMYRFYAELAGASLKEVNYQPPQLEFPLADLLDAISPRTGAVIVANPNNPTGTGIGLSAVERILAKASGVPVLFDEAYFEFHGVTALPLLDRYPNLFVSRTFSKCYGMAAMRIGCLFSSAGNVAFLRKAQSPYSVNSLAVMAAAEAVQDQEYVRRFVAEVLEAREMLCAALDDMSIAYVPSAANFVLIYAGARAREVCDSLREKAILVRDRSYEIPGGVRITAGTREQTQRVIDELKRIW